MAELIVLEWQVFLHSFLCGLEIWLIYDVLLMLRIMIPHANWIRALEDLAFWVYAAIRIFSVLYTYNYGMLRGYTTLGVLLGIVVHNFCLTRPLEYGFSKIWGHFHKKVQKTTDFLSKNIKKRLKIVKKSIMMYFKDAV